MIMEWTVCELVRRHWNDLHPNTRRPDSVVCLKVAGKTSPNAAIIAMILDAHRRCPVAVAKIPRNPMSASGVEREYDAMRDIRESVSDPRILQHTLCRGKLVESDGVKILLEAAAVGHPMVREMTRRESVEGLYERILSWMFDFHADGAEECILEGEALRTLVEAPIGRFVKQFWDTSTEAFSSEARQYISELPRKVEGRTVRLCRQHGDFNAHNTLVEYNRGRFDNFTLIDWEDYSARELPIYDLNHFFITNASLIWRKALPEESFKRVLLEDVWYRSLYLKAINDYDSRGFIGRETFKQLLPLYLVQECLRGTMYHREQQWTAPTWIRRLSSFVEFANGECS